MKTKIIVIAIILMQVSCKRDAKVCEKYSELTDRNHVVDPNLIGDQALIDTLSKRPELQLYKIESSQNIKTIKCNVFYRDLKVFSTQYYLHKYSNNPNIYSLNFFDFSSINFSLNPTISHDVAITIAQKNMDYSATCISYRLGIFDINARLSNLSVNYKLVWQIEGEHGYPIVTINANDGTVYRKVSGLDG